MPSQDRFLPRLKQAILSSPRAKRTITRMFAAVALGGGLLCLSVGIQNLKLTWDSQAWPKAEGKILSSSVKDHEINNRKSHQAAVMYEYRVGSTVFHGSQLSTRKSHPNDLANAQDQVNRFPVGKEVTVHYQAFNPQLAVLETETTVRDWLMPSFGVICLGIAVYVGLWLPRKFE